MLQKPVSPKAEPASKAKTAALKMMNECMAADGKSNRAIVGENELTVLLQSRNALKRLL